MKAGMAHNDTIYRCINASCGRGFPRRVNFCPWCGTGQTAPAPAPMLAKAELPAAAPAAPMPAPAPAAAPAAPRPTPAAAHMAPPAAVPIPPPAATSINVAPVPPVAPPRPDHRKPIRLRWWLIALGALWLAWMLTKPLEARIERRMKAAIALAQECKPRAAQDELIALRKTRATPAQLRRVQDALNAAAAACTRAERRRGAWKEASAATEALLGAGSLERASSRLSAFTTRWGEDERTRALRQRIDDERTGHRLADPTRGE